MMTASSIAMLLFCPFTSLSFHRPRAWQRTCVEYRTPLQTHGDEAHWRTVLGLARISGWIPNVVRKICWLVSDQLCPVCSFFFSLWIYVRVYSGKSAWLQLNAFGGRLCGRLHALWGHWYFRIWNKGRMLWLFINVIKENYLDALYFIWEIQLITFQHWFFFLNFRIFERWGTSCSRRDSRLETR